MTKYAFRTDAGSMTIEAEDAQAAAVAYALSERISGVSDLGDLVAHYESIDGAWLRVSEDGCDIAQAGKW